METYNAERLVYKAVFYKNRFEFQILFQSPIPTKGINYLPYEASNGWRIVVPRVPENRMVVRCDYWSKEIRLRGPGECFASLYGVFIGTVETGREILDALAEYSRDTGCQLLHRKVDPGTPYPADPITNADEYVSFKSHMREQGDYVASLAWTE